MASPFIGQIVLFAGNFAPRGWALCHGQLLAISQNTALFSILGTTYGGNGQTTFALPDFRGRVPVGPGQGPGLSDYDLGEQTGTEAVTLLVAEIPSHNHQANCTNNTADEASPGGHIWATDASGVTGEYSTGSPSTTMGAAAIAPTGGNQPHTNIQPVLCVNFIIALEGIFPSRN